MTVSLVLGYVEIRDKGIVQKKIRVKNRSFDDVLKDIDVFFKARGKRLAPGILEETLTRIGVPRARSILVDAPEPSEEKPKKPTKKPKRTTTKPSKKPAKRKTKTPPKTEEKEPAPKETPVEVEPEPHQPAADTSTEVVHGSSVSVQTTRDQPSETTGTETVVAKEEAGGATFVARDESLDSGIKFLSGDDFSDILEALTIVESMSDEFVPPAEQGTPRPQTPSIRISLSGTEELRASSKTHAVDSDQMQSVKDKVEPAPEPEPEAAGSEAGAETAASTGEAVAKAEAEHIIKPIIMAKGIVLGEEGVGKKSLLAKAKMGHPKVEGVEHTHIYENIYELSTHRVHLQSWCFDDAAKANVSRRQFYDGTGVAIIVYSVVDRWSFDSVDFWVKEVTNSLGYTPPIVLVGNKVDLRAGQVSADENPISQDEGYKLAEMIANKFGEGGSLHPVGFVETSCLTGQGVDGVFVTAAKLWLMFQSK